MATDFTIHKLKKGLDKAYPIYGYDCKDEENWDDYDEIAYFPSGSFILKLLDTQNSKAWVRYSKDEQEIYKMYGQIPICKDDVAKAIARLKELEKTVDGMPYDKDEDRGKLMPINLSETGLTEGLHYDIVDTIKIGNDRKHDIVWVATGTKNARAIIKAVYDAYGVVDYKFSYPWDISSGLKKWKYAEHELAEFEKIYRVFEEEPEAQVFYVYG